jgi:hypothetical protein
MSERRDTGRIISDLELQLKELVIAYEQYFAGVEKREPILDRETLGKRLRHFTNRRIIQTDLRYRFQNLATRFHVHCGYWDRTLRLIEEGRYHRQLGHRPKAPPAPAAATPLPAEHPAADTEFDTIFGKLVAAHQACNLQIPARHQVEEFLSRQKEKIREKFGDREVEYRVETEGGKPRLKVRAKT